MEANGPQSLIRWIPAALCQYISRTARMTHQNTDMANDVRALELLRTNAQPASGALILRRKENDNSFKGFRSSFFPSET